MDVVKFRVEGHIAYVTLNDPAKLNAISMQLACELEECWAEVRDNRDIWVAVLNGEGRSFCAGANTEGMGSGNYAIETHSVLMGVHRAGPLSHKVYKPIIAAVHRHVLGGGLALVLESDICIAADDALFGLPEAKVNVPTLFAPVIDRFLPHSLASEMLYTAKPVSAQRAYEAGLCSRVVPREKLMEEAEAMALSICETGPLANFAAKELYYRGRGLDYDALIPLLQEVAVPVMNSEDGLEGRRAFKEKRKPVWRCR